MFARSFLARSKVVSSVLRTRILRNLPFAHPLPVLSSPSLRCRLAFTDLPRNPQRHEPSASGLQGRGFSNGMVSRGLSENKPATQYPYICMSTLRKTELSNWQFCQAGEDVWRDAVVPGHVHVDLMRHAVIEDPFIRDNESKCQWVDETDWSYRCSFEWHAKEGLPHQVIRFEGLDTVCSVSINGKLVAQHDNMFVPLEIDATGLLVDGANEIRVDFQSAARIGRERKERYLAEQSLPEDTPNFDERAFVRKAQYMFGWDWGPRLVSCGIWKPAHLLEFADREEASNWTHSTNASILSNKRSVRLIQRPDEEGASFEFEVDGKPFFALGANWIPDHSFPSQVSRARYRERLQQAKDMGMNMLRVWGGGIYEDDAFYEICDELGILVWQDFMFACSYYPDAEEWQEAIRTEAEYQVRRLRNHPCIAIWCGNNECHQVWQDGWGGKDKQPPRFHGEVLYHEILRDVVERLDPGRAYWPGSPYGTGYCNSGKDGDQHYWDVWHGRGDWTYYKESDARFCSEFGFLSSPSAATWKHAGIDTSIDKEDPIARSHNKTGKPFNIITDLVKLHYPEAKTLDEWSYYTQLNQRDAMRAAIEHYRFSGRCKGALLWQLNDCWPVESWSVLEYEGIKKAVAYELERLFAPILIRLEGDEKEVSMSVCLHNADEPVSGVATLQARGLLDNEVHIERSVELRLEPGDAQRVMQLRSDGFLPMFWAAEFVGAKGLLYRQPVVGCQTVMCGDWLNANEMTFDAPCLDAWFFDAMDPGNLIEPHFGSFLPGDKISVRSSRPIREMRARCPKFF